MIQGSVSGALLAISLLAGAAASMAEAGTMGNGTAGSGFQQFRYEADAQKHCPHDNVVWGSSAHRGIYYTKGAGPQRVGGYYACMADVKKRGYKIGM
jgi:hypothetical protein